MAIIFDIADQQSLRETVLHQPVWKKVLDWLAQLDENASLGEHIIDAHKGITATLTKSALNRDPKIPFESHQKNIDVHLCLIGREVINSTPVTCLQRNEGDTANDVILYLAHRHHSDILMSPGLVAIFFPPDGHRPLRQSYFLNDYVKKVVVKIPVTALY